MEIEKQLAANNAEIAVESEVDPLGESEEAMKAREAEVKEKQLKLEKIVSMYGRDQRYVLLYYIHLPSIPVLRQISCTRNYLFLKHCKAMKSFSMYFTIFLFLQYSEIVL